MNFKKIFFTTAFAFALLGRASQAQQIAFPTAEGFGKYASGGRGGKVVYVTNLNDSGAGSFREAVTAKYPRIVLFSVSGTIHLQSPLFINKDNITIAGHSAPGDGICLADHPVSIKANNVIIRYLRFRMGDKNQNKGKVNGAGGDDAFGGGSERKHIIIDHCTMSWSTDEAFSIYAGDSTTVQWNIISEPLNYSYHFETGDTDFEHHGYGGIWGGAHLSAHHNLFAHCENRTPRFEGNRHIPQEFVDYRNNVIYNWGSNNVYAGEGGNYNLVNNYYKYGPATKESVKYRVTNPYKTNKIPFGKYYIAGNYVDGSADVSNDNWKGVVMNQGTEEDKLKSKMSTAFTADEIKTQRAEDAYKSVLAHGGASLPKQDTIDERIIRDVKDRTGRIIDVQGGFEHGTPYEKSAKAWAALKSVAAPKDSDKDGMPDEWELKIKLNPKSAADGNQYTLSSAYTNIEVYLNSLENWAK